jgi:hypothetical protein
MSHFAPHPARDAEFLSRLHDGELNAAERAQFESHRAHCVECRNAAFEFESALSLYRSSRPRPPAPDLSARILRRLQESQRRRPPLGASFGIDLRWAGAFAAALIAAIVGFSIVARQETSRKLAARDAAIPVTMEQRVAENQAPKAAAEAPASAVESGAGARRESALAKDVKGEARADTLPSSAPPERAQSNAVPVPPSIERKELAARDKSSVDARGASAAAAADRLDIVPQAAAPGRAAGFVAERQGGEGVAGSQEFDAASVLPLRFTITAIDGGSRPELLGDEKLDLPAGERGREYSLSVDAQGRVSDVRPVENRRLKIAKPQAPSNSAAKLEPSTQVKPPRALWDLRFRPGDRPRLLRVKIE